MEQASALWTYIIGVAWNSHRSGVPYAKEGPNTMILTSNTSTNNWDEFFTGDDTLLCTLDRLFDRASVFVMKGASFRGAELEIFSVESSPTATKMNK